MSLDDIDRLVLAEVDLIRKHYGDFSGLYDPAQAIAHIKVLLAEINRLETEQHTGLVPRVLFHDAQRQRDDARAERDLWRNRCDGDAWERITAQRDDALAEVERLTGKLAAYDNALWLAGIEHPIGAQGIRDLAAMALGRLEQLRAVEADRDKLSDELAKATDEIERLTRHSKTLNTIGFAAAIALGDATPDTDTIEGNPIDQIRRLLDLTNPKWLGRDKLDRALAHLATAKHSGTEATGDHPERKCQRCHGQNVVWCAPSPLWNEVMRGDDINAPDRYEVVCPTCFAVLANEQGVANTTQPHTDQIGPT